MPKIKHILVPTDFDESAEQALQYAVELSQQFGARLTLLHVYEIPVHAYTTMMYPPEGFVKELGAAARKKLDEAVNTVRKQVPEATSILHAGTPGEQILTAIKETGADLVVMGTHGRRGLGHVMFGSVAEKTVRQSPIPVLVVRSAAQR